MGDCPDIATETDQTPPLAKLYYGQWRRNEVNLDPYSTNRTEETV